MMGQTIHTKTAKFVALTDEEFSPIPASIDAKAFEIGKD